LGNTFAQIGSEINPVRPDGEDKVGVRFDDRQRLPANEDRVGGVIESDRTLEDEPALFDVHGYASLSAPSRQEISKAAQRG